MNGFVLAGGRSTRMGRDKALLQYAGRPLIEHAVQVLIKAGLAPHIIGSRPDLASYAPVIEDRHAGCGPLGGIEAALTTSSSEWNVFLPVDLPHLPAAFLEYLKQRVAITEAAATIPLFAGRPQPLCAVYHRSLLAGISRSIERQDFKVISGIKEAISASEIDMFSVEAVATANGDWLSSSLYRWFHNLNSPQDLA